MEIVRKTRWREPLIIFILTMLLVINYYKGFDMKNTSYYEFGRTSQCLVEMTVYAAKENIDKTVYGLGHLNEEGKDYEQVSDELPSSDNLVVRPYQSQFGLQGNIFYTLAKILPFSYDKLLQIFMLSTSTAMSVTIIFIVLLIGKKYNWFMAGTFYLVFLSSPWICVFARDLYWVEFTWFLPMLVGLWFSIRERKVCYIFAFLTILIKALCGYEYITAVMLGLLIFPLADFLEKKDPDRKRCFVHIVGLGLMAFVGFITAYFVHAYFNGDGNIIQGITQIYENVAVRRTSGRGAEQVSVWQVLYMYTCFETELIAGVGGNLFTYFVVGSLFVLGYNRFYKNTPKLQQEILFFLTLAVSVSWFVLGKAHSYNHTHMNYVLWYFGFVQICIYILLDAIKDMIGKSN